MPPPLQPDVPVSRWLGVGLLGGVHRTAGRRRQESDDVVVVAVEAVGVASRWLSDQLCGCPGAELVAMLWGLVGVGTVGLRRPPVPDGEGCWACTWSCAELLEAELLSRGADGWRQEQYAVFEKIVGDDERPPRVDSHTDRPATGLAVGAHEAGDDIDRRPPGPAAANRE